MKKAICVFCLSLGLVSWQSIQSVSINKMNWLLGTWKMNSANGIVLEKWNKVNDNQFKGISFLVKEKDTVLLETIELIQEQSTIKYIPTVVNQNEGKPIVFTMTSFNEERIVFENKTHDFPQQIIYNSPVNDTLRVLISGYIMGEKKQRVFTMVKNN